MTAATSLAAEPTLAALSPRLQRALHDELCRRSLLAFCQAAYTMLYPGQRLDPPPYLQALVHQLERIARGDTRRLICNVPPRHGKSDFGTCMLTAWMLGRDPTAKVFVVSYGLSLSTVFTRKIRALVKHPTFRRIFPETRIRVGEDREGDFVLTRGGGCLATSQGGAVTGLGAHLMILDDYQKADDAQSPVERENAINTFRNTLVSRFDNLADGRILINQQRLHEDDISGFAASIGTWDQLVLPSIADADQRLPLGQGRVWHRRKGELLDPARAPLAFLDEQKRMQGDRYFSAQYQQNPIGAEGGLIDLQWFGQYEERPERSFFHKVVQSLDPAITERITSDYSVGMTWGYRDGHWYLLDLFRQQLAFPALRERMLAWHKQWRADVLVIEGASIGLSLYQEAHKANLPGALRAPTPSGSKQDRLAARTAQLATGDYLLPADAPWLWDLRRELMAFPDGAHDDQVDALTLFLQVAANEGYWLTARVDERGRPIRVGRPARHRPHY